MNLNRIHSVYFVGIGGIGMSALAAYFLHRGVKVAGYDRQSSDVTVALEAMGAAIHFTDDAQAIPQQVDLAVYTPAIPADFGELEFLKNKQVPLMKRAQVLGLLSKGHKTLAVAGTHGKTTTSSMLAHLLKHSDCDVTAFLGGICLNFDSNFVPGSPQSLMVVEADEFDRSFLQLHPFATVITSMDADHLDIYGTPDNVKASFNEYAMQVEQSGYVVVKKGLESQINATAQILTYGAKGSDFFASNIRVENHMQCFDLEGMYSIKGIRCGLPGLHNIENATAAIALALLNGLSENNARAGMESFKGVKRRFEYRFKSETLVLIDDYAHHPEELKACIGSAKALYEGQKITGFFQPHLYTRTRDFATEFARSLDMLDQIYLLDIYPAREKPIEGVSSEMLLSLMQNPKAEIVRKQDVLQKLDNAEHGVVLFMGAGDIDLLLNPAVSFLENKRNQKTT